MSTLGGGPRVRVVLIRRGDKLNDERREYVLAQLPQREQERIRGFSHWRGAQSSLLGHLLLRRLAARELGEDQPILFDRDSRGRPFLLEPAESGVDLNMSHSGDYVAAAISVGQRVGIDVQLEREVRADVAKRCFAHSEREWIDQRPGDASSRFFQLWTLKEAYLKATGQGIATDLKAIVFRVVSETEISVRVDECSGPKWRFRSWRLGDQAWMSLCVDGAEPPGAYEDEPDSIA